MKVIGSAAFALLVAMSIPATLSAQDSQSGPLARELTSLMISQKLNAVAARDPDAPDRFVAAMAFPDVQLLVVSGRYTSPSVLQAQLVKREYADVYAAIQQASLPESRVFFQDLKADGLRAKSSEAVDVMYERVVNQTIFDGNPAKQKMSAAAYADKFKAADALYSRMLMLLIGELKGSAVIVHVGLDGWARTRDVEAVETGLGVWVTGLETDALGAMRDVGFTFDWPDADRWEGVDFHVRVTR